MRFAALLFALTGCGRIGFSLLGDDVVTDGPGDGPGDGPNDGPMVQPPSGAAAVFHFDEGTGSTTAEASNLVSGALASSSFTPGIRNSAVQIGAAGFVDFPAEDGIRLTGPLTIGVWYHLDRLLTTGECVPLLIHGSAGTAGLADNDIYAFNLISSRYVLYSERDAQIPNSAGTDPIAPAFTPNVWHHGIAKRDNAGNVSFHVDGGAEVGALQMVGDVAGGNNGHLRIGADVETSSCGSFPGAIDELYLYPRELDSTEARALFDAR